MVHVPIPKKGVGGIEVAGRKPAQDLAADLVHNPPAFGDAGQAKRAPLAAGMLKGIEEARHFDELDRTIEVMSEPELLEVRYVSEIPEDRAHQGIMLHLELLVRQGRDE
jgi:hypothetical protein